MLANLGRLEDAIEAFDQALSLKPDFPDAWFLKGMALANLGRHNEAVHWLCRAWRAFEQLPDNRVVVEQALRELGHDPEECESERGKGFFRRLFGG